MPVLPLVGSTITRSVPGYSSPCASAASNIASAMRSLTDPDGLAPSSLAQIRTPVLGLKLGSSTSGVLPIDIDDQLAQRRALGGDAALAPDARPKHGRNTYVGHQRSAEGGDRRAAERLVVDELMDGRIVTAQRAIGVARDLDLAELHAQ